MEALNHNVWRYLEPVSEGHDPTYRINGLPLTVKPFYKIRGH